ncbi:hypothetical protein K9L16_03855, partial [Candidatus Pacearchaeota archaeon]|nr:hypothetical protein [Candidatus Pacearchaeota archaeon]
MKNKFIYLFASLIFLIGFASLASAIPQTFSINGRLTNQTTGDALTGTYSVNFSIYDNYTSGSPLWSGVYSVTTDSNGVCHVLLNNIDLDFGEQYYLGMKVGSDSEMSPRVNLTSSPYSFRANISDTLNETGNYTVGNFFVNGKLGVGATSPSYPLEVNGSIYSTGASGGVLGVLNPDNQDASASLSWLNNIARIRVGGSGAGASSGLDIQGPGDVSYMRVTSTGVGIGTTSPNATLHVAGDINATSGNDICIDGGACLSSVGSSGANVTSSGSANYIPKFTSGSNIGNS